MSNSYMIALMLVMTMMVSLSMAKITAGRGEEAKVLVVSFHGHLEDLAARIQQNSAPIAADIRDLSLVGGKNHRSYAKYHGYSYTNITSWSARDGFDKCGSWAALKELMTGTRKSPFKYEWVFVIDGDSLISDFRRPLSVFTKHMASTKDLLLGATLEFGAPGFAPIPADAEGLIKPAQYRPNPTAMIIRVTDWSKKLMTDFCARSRGTHSAWLSHFAVEMSNPEYASKIATRGHEFVSNPVFWNPETFICSFDAYYNYGDGACVSARFDLPIGGELTMEAIQNKDKMFQGCREDFGVIAASARTLKKNPLTFDRWTYTRKPKVQMSIFHLIDESGLQPLSAAVVASWVQ